MRIFSDFWEHDNAMQGSLGTVFKFVYKVGMILHSNSLLFFTCEVFLSLGK